MPFYIDEALDDYANTVELQARGWNKVTGENQQGVYRYDYDSLNYVTIAKAPFNCADFSPEFSIEISWSSTGEADEYKKFNATLNTPGATTPDEQKSKVDVLNQKLEMETQRVIEEWQNEINNERTGAGNWRRKITPEKLNELYRRVARSLDSLGKGVEAKHVLTTLGGGNPLDLLAQRRVSSSADNFKSFRGSRCGFEMPSRIIFSYVNKGDHEAYLEQVFELLRLVLPQSGRFGGNMQERGGLTYVERAPNFYRVLNADRSYQGIMGDFQVRVGHLWYRHLVPQTINIKRSNDIDVVDQIKASKTVDWYTGIEDEATFDNSVASDNLFKKLFVRSMIKTDSNNKSENDNKVKAEPKGNFYAIPHSIQVEIGFAPCVKYFPDDIVLTLFNAQKEEGGGSV